MFSKQKSGSVLKALALASLIVSTLWWFQPSRETPSSPSFETIKLAGDDTDEFPLTLQTASWLFNAVHNTMRILGNTVARAGFSFVPGYIPAGTLLYHGKRGAAIPHGMEWFALDVEYSLNMLHGPFMSSNDSHLLTFTNTHPLKIVNIDGASAALYPDGTMDSQGFLLNQTKEDWIGFKEYERAALLCELGKEFGVDGYVRLNTGFELIMCSFQNPKLALISNVRVEIDTDDGLVVNDKHHASLDDLHLIRESRMPPQSPEIPEYNSDTRANHLKHLGQHLLSLTGFDSLLGGPPQDRPGHPPGHPPGHGPPGHPGPPHGYRPPRNRNPVVGYEWVQAGVRHFYGDSRVVPDYRGFISIYGRDKFQVEGPIYTHRLLDAPESLAQEIRSDLLAVMSVDQPSNEGQGINWRTVTDEIIGKYKPILTSINNTFYDLQLKLEDPETNDNDTKTDIEKAWKAINSVTYILAHRFLDLDKGQNIDSKASVELCIASWDPSITATFALTTLERRILSAVRTITKELCEFVFDAQRLSRNAKIHPAKPTATASDDIEEVSAPNNKDLHALAERVKSLIDTLAWIDFMECPEKCGPSQLCYFPLWPFSYITKEDYNVGLRCVDINSVSQW